MPRPRKQSAAGGTFSLPLTQKSVRSAKIRIDVPIMLFTPGPKGSILGSCSAVPEHRAGRMRPSAWQRRDTRRYHPARPRRPARSVRRGPCAAWRPITSKEVPTMSATTLFSIGEALIDMIPSQSGCAFAEVPAFRPRIGGAPANVCGAFAVLGGRAALLTQLGTTHSATRSPTSWPPTASTSAASPSPARPTRRLPSSPSGPTATGPSAFTAIPRPTCSTAPARSTPPGSGTPLPCISAGVSLVESPMKAAHDAAIQAAGEAGPSSALTPTSASPLARPRRPPAHRPGVPAPGVGPQDLGRRAGFPHRRQ